QTNVCGKHFIVFSSVMLEISPKSFEEVFTETKKGNVVPIVGSVLADLHTPTDAFLRVCAAAEKAFLFESIEGGERLARYSFLAANPQMIIRARKAEVQIEKNNATETLRETSLFDFLREYFKKNKLARRENLPPLCGGAIGFLTYNAVRRFEPVLDDGKFSESDDAVWMFFQTVLAFDRLKQRIEIVSVVFTDEAKDDKKKLRELYENALCEIEKIEHLLNQNVHFPPSEKSTQQSDFVSNWSKKGFTGAVTEIQEKILAGDAYQVVLSQKFSRQTSADALDIYRALRSLNPSPYMFFVKTGDKTLIGASPEMLVRAHGKNLEYCPIAGTRKRGKTEAEDLALGAEMRADAKEVSEHTMLVDLGRNDLGRVAEYGSVEVAKLMKIEKYSHVQHLVTSLKAKLRDGFDCFDALAACFPAGTVSGAPKVSAMKIIDELEPTPRGVYAGTVGYIDYAGNLDTCIAIRKIELENGTASVQAGAGIVADSVPESEFEETINKARALIKAIEMAENGF
ncbi:MAG: anthranilate synthase component I family protein, partial [Pyrinomonadaceae bacterium]